MILCQFFVKNAKNGDDAFVTVGDIAEKREGGGK